MRAEVRADDGIDRRPHHAGHRGDGGSDDRTADDRALPAFEALNEDHGDDRGGNGEPQAHGEGSAESLEQAADGGAEGQQDGPRRDAREGEGEVELGGSEIAALLDQLALEHPDGDVAAAEGRGADAQGNFRQARQGWGRPPSGRKLVDGGLGLRIAGGLLAQVSMVARRWRGTRTKSANDPGSARGN